jgi:O-antigen ligase
MAGPVSALSLAVKVMGAPSCQIDISQDHTVPLDRPFFPLSGSCLAICGVTVFAPLIEGGTTYLPVTIIRLILLYVACIWLIRGMQAERLTITDSPLLGPVVAFTGLAGVSIFWSVYMNVSLQGAVNLVSYSVFFVLVLAGVTSRRHVKMLVMLLLGMGLFEGGLGIVQYVWLGEARARGTFFNPNFFATYEVAMCMLALGLLIGLRQGDVRWRERLFLAFAAAITFSAMVMAQSRGAVLAFLMAVTFLGLYRYGKAALIVLVCLIVSGIIFPNPVKQRFLDVGAYDPYAYTRFEIWKNSLERITDRPLGTGLGTYKYSSFQYRFPIEHAIVQYGKRAESAHNEYLQMGVELGIAGVVLFFFGLGIWGREAKRVFALAASRLDRGIAIGMCSGVVAIIVHAGVDSVFHEPALVLLLVLLGSLVLTLSRLDGIGQTQEWRHPFPNHPIRMVLAGILLVSFACLSIQPAAAWFASEQGSRALMNGDDGSALEWYRRATLIDPGTTGHRDAVARLYVNQFSHSGDPSWLIQAGTELKICMALNPLDGRFPYRLGAVYLLLSEQPALASQRDELVSQAAGAFEKAVIVDPFSPFSYLELGKIRRAQGERMAAQTFLTRAIAHEPNFLPARTMLADLATEMGHPETAAAQRAMIHDIQLKYQGQTLNHLEQQFLTVESAKLP